MQLNAKVKLIQDDPDIVLSGLVVTRRRLMVGRWVGDN